MKGLTVIPVYCDAALIAAIDKCRGKASREVFASLVLKRFLVAKLKGLKRP